MVSASGSSTVVEHTTHQPKIKGSNPDGENHDHGLQNLAEKVFEKKKS